MTTLIRSLLVGLLLLAGASAAWAQSSTNDTDPRQMALDIYSGINRGVEPATIAQRLRAVIEVFRYRCTRVSDYQIFAQRPNITDIKVKCSGDPLYGVTVASNGFVSVYGGNSILAPLDRRDALILSFGAEGDVEDTSAFDAERIKDETISRVMLGGEYDYIYLAVMMLMLVIILSMMIIVFVRIARKRTGRKPRSRMKPMKKFKVGYSSKVKDQIVAESEEIAKYVYKHHSGVFVAIGKRGKRRMFVSAFWAKMYAKYNLHFKEATEEELSKIDLQLADDVEIVEEGDEVEIPT